MQNAKQNIPLMPKSTAVWLVENTSLTFKQIATFCGLHELEVKGIADGDVAKGIVGMDPINMGQLTKEEIERCSADSNASLNMISAFTDKVSNKTSAKKKQTKYTPIARRRDKPDAIFWLIKNFPDVPDSQIVKLIGTTKSTIEAIRSRTYWNINELRPRDPVLLGLCTQREIDNLEIAQKAKKEQN
jgi:hypothetical protein